MEIGEDPYRGGPPGPPDSAGSTEGAGVAAEPFRRRRCSTPLLTPAALRPVAAATHGPPSPARPWPGPESSVPRGPCSGGAAFGVPPPSLRLSPALGRRRWRPGATRHYSMLPWLCCAARRQRDGYLGRVGITMSPRPGRAACVLPPTGPGWLGWLDPTLQSAARRCCC